MGETNVDECDEETSFPRNIETITESIEALLIPMLFAQ